MSNNSKKYVYFLLVTLVVVFSAISFVRCGAATSTGAGSGSTMSFTIQNLTK